MAITTGLLGAVSLAASEFYVAPGGDGNNPGTIDLPFASIGQGQQAAAAGDTVWLRGGDNCSRAGDLDHADAGDGGHNVH